MTDYTTLRYEQPAEHVVRIVLNRPAAANALDSTLLGELSGSSPAHRGRTGGSGSAQAST
jgi:1,4-dihydroxy-2-naphthoyl-CoA synthase